jgi:hypothetical protein
VSINRSKNQATIALATASVSARVWVNGPVATGVRHRGRLTLFVLPIIVCTPRSNGHGAGFTRAKVLTRLDNCIGLQACQYASRMANHATEIRIQVRT